MEHVNLGGREGVGGRGITGQGMGDGLDEERLYVCFSQRPSAGKRRD